MSSDSKHIRWPLHLGRTSDGGDLHLPLEALRRHFLALGGSGSGKTVLCKAVVEEAIRYNLPCIVVDLQGDLLSLGSHADPEDQPLDAPRVSDLTVSKYRERLDLKVWTPGSTRGIPLSFAPNMTVPRGVHGEDRVHAIGTIAADVAGMIGDVSDATIAGLHTVLEHSDQHGHPCDSIASLSALLANPPAQLMVELEQLLPDRARKKILQALAIKKSGANRLLYSTGWPIDVHELLGCRVPGPANEGKARLSIIYLAHLSPARQQEFLALLFSAMYRFGLAQDGQLAGLLLIDEIAQLCPPVTKPPAKAGLMLLLRQARKYGICMALATQSPGDVDYKALGQIGTLALGKLGDDAGLARVASMLRSVPGVDAKALIQSLHHQTAGEFVMINSDHLDGPTRMRARWLATEHRLVSETEIRGMVTDEDRVRLGGTQALARGAA